MVFALKTPTCPTIGSANNIHSFVSGHENQEEQVIIKSLKRKTSLGLGFRCCFGSWRVQWKGFWLYFPITMGSSWSPSLVSSVLQQFILFSIIFIRHIFSQVYRHIHASGKEGITPSTNLWEAEQKADECEWGKAELVMPHQTSLSL